MPQDSETGESYDSPEAALAAALPEGVDAEAVLAKLKEDGYSLEPSGEGAEEGEDVGLAIAIGPPPEAEGADKELGPGGPPPSIEEALAAGPEGPPLGLTKKRDKVAEKLAGDERFRKDMV